MNIRLDKLPPLTVIEIEIKYGLEEVVFLGIEGEGEDRLARMLSRGTDGKVYEWAAYRYGGRWCYGTSGDRMTIRGARVINDTGRDR